VTRLTYDWNDLAAVIELVGPKGYSHGWVKDGKGVTDPSGWGAFRRDAKPGMQLKYGYLSPGEDKQYPEHEFGVGQLTPTQRRDEHESPGPGEPGDPFVITSGDRHYLIDGHHRAAAAGPGGRIVAQHLDLDFPEDRFGNPVNVDPS
jgi:hypothetical protein